MIVAVAVVVIGESGLGKSTLVNTLFKAKVSRPSCMQVSTPIPSTVDINAVSHGELYPGLPHYFCPISVGNPKQNASARGFAPGPP